MKINQNLNCQECMELDAVTVRKKWMRSWKVMLGYQIVIGSFFLAYGAILGWEVGGEDAALGITLSLLAIFWLFLCRKCAYEKPGTKLLTFVLGASGFGMVKRLLELMQSDFNLYDIADYAVFMFIFILFVIRSLRLIDFNKKSA